jgi:hypothetical protein
MHRSYAFRLGAAFAIVGAAAAVLTAVAVNVVVGGLLSGYFEQRQAAQQDQVASGTPVVPGGSVAATGRGR